ncbi:MAG: orotidine 5'-phosphate decarboxylase / HUMPS family protein [Caldimicrobium sp.]
MKEAKEKIIFPLDFQSLEEALHWVERLNPYVGIFKIGLELFVKEGPKSIEAIKKRGASKVFLDLKLFDIPNTVAGAVRSASSYGIDYLTVHILSGRKALEKALELFGKGYFL